MRRYFWIMQPAARTRGKRVGSGWSSARLNVRLNTRRFVLLTAKTAYPNAGRIDSPCFPPIYFATVPYSARLSLTMVNDDEPLERHRENFEPGKNFIGCSVYQKDAWAAFGKPRSIDRDRLKKFDEIWLSSLIGNSFRSDEKTRRNFDDSNHIFS